VNVSIKVPLDEREYNIEIGQGLLLNSSDYIFPLLRRQKVVIVTDENVAALHLETLENSLDTAEIFHSTLTLPPGEATKSWTYLQKTVDFLLEEKTERADVIIALGGGVIGDLVGFAAAILRRGVNLFRSQLVYWLKLIALLVAKQASTPAKAKTLWAPFINPA